MGRFLAVFRAVPRDDVCLYDARPCTLYAYMYGGDARGVGGLGPLVACSSDVRSSSGVCFARTLHRSDIQHCGIVCLDHDAFQFPGAAAVTTAYIQNNPFAALPEKLLWNMTSLRFLYARSLVKLTTLPERLFLDKARLVLIFLTASYNLRVLPDGLLKGLSSLKYFSLLYISFTTLPNLDDLKACSFILMSGAASDPPSWHLDAHESESAFDGLVAVQTLWMAEQALSRVPSVKNMRNLEELSLSRNKITDLGIGAFRVRSAGGQESVRNRPVLRPCCFPQAIAAGLTRWCTTRKRCWFLARVGVSAGGICVCVCEGRGGEH